MFNSLREMQECLDNNKNEIFFCSFQENEKIVVA